MEFPAIWGLVQRLRTFPEADFWNFWGVLKEFLWEVSSRNDVSVIQITFQLTWHRRLILDVILTWLHRCKLSDSLVSVSNNNNEDPMKSKLTHIPKYQNPGTETYQTFHTPTKNWPQQRAVFVGLFIASPYQSPRLSSSAKFVGSSIQRDLSPVSCVENAKSSKIAPLDM